MADFIPYQHPEPRDVNPDKIVRLSLDRWQSLVDYIAEHYGDKRPGEQITVYEPTDVGGIWYLPALYRSA